MSAGDRSQQQRAPFGSVLLGPEDQSPKRLRVRIQLLLTALLITTHLVGAGVVFVISVFVLPTQALNHASMISLAITVPTYVAAAVLVGGFWGTLSSLRGLRWALEGRDPTPAERRRALRTPLRLTLIQGGLWFVAFVIFSVQALIVQPDRAMGTGFAIVISGLVVSTIAYLQAEFVLRPIAARALSGRGRSRRGVTGVQARMLLFWGIGTAAPIVGLAVAAMVALTSAEMSKNRLAIIALALCGVVLVFGLMVTVLNARSVVAPIASVRNALDRVRTGDFDVEVTVFDGTELGLLQAGFNDMARGLREREAIRDMFGRHVGKEVADAAAHGEVVLGGETRVVSVLFIDLIGSTTYATERSPIEVVATLNRFLAVVVEEVDAQGGFVNKFIGDAALAIFGAPVEHPDHPTAALVAARRIATRLRTEVAEIEAGIGVATGEAVAGNIGDESRFEYTVIGDSVNSAARLCDLAKAVPGHVSVAAETVRLADAEEASSWVPDGEVVLRGRAEPTATARLRG
ncbi:adenylate/guanylate cyclase domain-containing protein [Nocardioides marmoriginsengisoli]|uniref:Adenylate/guanylate cyclase domain-containing protein n=1 Tax=Nocardioides marmoriginsengisoli TaxID=661483 RepID=A0A3N0CFX3_9ACTN|nr:adenylate/guanylate cyclase domain-containing protein [Nocardioides marmoriginsengisoli]RNL62348.1 adenylate/guanylate cyclase domain-containing protein [Nocardioides marmoriginsengisoli]